MDNIKPAFLAACRSHRFSPKTTKSYWCAANKYIQWCGAETINDLKTNAAEKFKAYLQEISQKKEVSRSAQNLAFHSSRFLLVELAGVQLSSLPPRPKTNGQRRLVEVPDAACCRALTSIQGTQGVALRLIYGTGCRLSEVLKLRIADLDFKKNLISIHFGKGGKSRLVPMPKSLVKELTKLVEGRHEDGYVFPSAKGEGHIADVTLQRALANAKAKHGIRKNYTIHSLRHAAAQFWESKGVERSRIQVLLGHSNSASTERYLVSGVKNVSAVPTPI